MQHGTDSLAVATSLLLLAGSAGSPGASAPSIQAKGSAAPNISTDGVITLLRAGDFHQLDAQISQIQIQYERNMLSDVQLRDAFRVFYDTDPQLESQYGLWISRFPKSYVALLARAIYYKKIGFDRRGGDYIGSTTPEQIRGMREAFEKAQLDLAASEKLTKKPFLSYFHAMDISSSDGTPEQTRHLLDLANGIDPKNFVARYKYMSTLTTRWGGSVAEMSGFLDECRRAAVPEEQLKRLEVLVVSDQAWVDWHRQNDYEAAIRDYRRAIAMSPECPPCLKRDFVAVLMHEHDFKEAIEVMSSILEEDSKAADIQTLRGSAYMQSGKSREALADWTAAAEAGEPSAQNTLGVQYMTGIPSVLSADRQIGISWFRRAAAQNYAPAQQNLATAMRNQGQ